ncbi:MAG TPA: Holliday junction branch migration protein RuvA [Desulfosalsimonadaceae bacterium]|nr:Holliday junction branch migration protein RuvA [Desulfosalsimonadaceae bacterium]
MIAYLEGVLLKKEADRIIILVNQVGYEVLVPAFVMESIHPKAIGDTLSLHIYYHQTERQPKPVLIGFNLEAEREFFQLFISVEAIGPLKAVKALNSPVSEIAQAIESKNAAFLKRLEGIGERTAQKIVATLQGRTEKFALISDGAQQKAEPAAQGMEELSEQVIAVLTGQLGHKANEARAMVDAALRRNPAIATPEELFEEVYRGEVVNGG